MENYSNNYKIIAINYHNNFCYVEGIFDVSKFDKSNCIIGGYPAKVLRENINCEK